jgi:HK97 family phage prohead protease
MEHKTFPAMAIKVNADEGIVEAIVAVIGNIDSGMDVIQPGAFTKTITERGGRIRCLDNHQTDSIMRVLGTTLAMREVGRTELPQELLTKAQSATGGLWVQTKYLLDTPEGRGAFIRIKEGAIDEYSIGYDALDMDYSKTVQDGKQVTIRNLRTVKLWDYSPVIWGMNAATVTMSAKTQGDGVMLADVTPDIETPSDDKEMTPTGPIQRMGDMFVGNLMAVCDGMLNSWLASGKISSEEHGIMRGAINQVTQMMSAAMPPDMSGRDCTPQMMDMMWMSAAGPEDVKTGRVLSGANATRLQRALTEINDILKTAGLLDEETPADEGKSAPSGADDSQQGQAGPLIAPTDFNHRLAAILEMELAECQN